MAGWRGGAGAVSRPGRCPTTRRSEWGQAGPFRCVFHRSLRLCRTSAFRLNRAWLAYRRPSVPELCLQHGPTLYRDFSGRHIRCSHVGWMNAWPATRLCGGRSANPYCRGTAHSRTATHDQEENPPGRSGIPPPSRLRCLGSRGGDNAGRGMASRASSLVTTLTVS